MWCLCTDVHENRLFPYLGYMTNGNLFMWVNMYLKSALFWVVTQRIVVIYQYTLRNSPEDRISHVHCGGSLKPRI
jgi:hypothetical protein